MNANDNESKRFKCEACQKHYRTGLFTCGECNFNVCINDMQLGE
jgi:hypothetical protein